MEELCRLPLDQLHGMGLFLCADMGIFPADKTGSGEKSEIMPLYGNSIGTADVKVEETAQRWLSSTETRNFFDLYAWDFKRKNAQSPVFFS